VHPSQPPGAYRDERCRTCTGGIASLLTDGGKLYSSREEDKEEVDGNEVLKLSSYRVGGTATARPRIRYNRSVTNTPLQALI
jgi:hypothetical protein